MIETTLRYQDVCPKCKANWHTLEEMLSESIESENWYLAMKIIENCNVCRKRFEGTVTFVNNKGGEEDVR